MSTLCQAGSRRWLDWLLRLIVALEVPIYLGARISLGPLVLAVPNPIPPASVVETILGIAAVANLAALLRGRRSPMRVTLGIQLFLLVGVSLGMVSLALRVGPPPSPDWNIHYVMLAAIAAAFLVLILLKAQKT